jgi:nickel/cobalt exporter
MRKILLGLFIFAVFSIQSAAVSAQNPFFASSKPQKTFTIPTPVPVEKFLQKIFRLQQQYIDYLTNLARKIKDGTPPGNFWPLMNLAFLYGVVHALGPGHGKTLTFSCCMASTSGHVKTGLLLGVLISVFQHVSAILTVLFLNCLVKQSFLSAFENISYWVKIGSYGLIAIIGFGLFISKIRQLVKSSVTAAFTAESRADYPGLLPVAFSIGLIPCPAATLILLFTLSLEILPIGIFMVGWMTLGAALTIAGVGIVTLLVKKGLFTLAGNNKPFIARMEIGVELLGALLIACFGLLLLFGSV